MNEPIKPESAKLASKNQPASLNKKPSSTVTAADVQSHEWSSGSAANRDYID